MQSSPEILVRLLVSIDRRKGVDDARDSLDLAQEFRGDYGDIIVGLSSDCAMNVWIFKLERLSEQAQQVFAE